MKKVWLKRNKNGEMGIGTMIIFIAMILVSAVAASVLIGTASKVREQAQNTGDQAINNIASGFVVQDVTGIVKSDFSSISDLIIQMRLQAGSPDINMDKVSIMFVSGSVDQMLSFVAGSAVAHGGAVGGTSYSANTTGTTTTWTTSEHVVNQGDLVTVTITGLTLIYSTPASVTIVPAYGTSTLVSFITPSYYSTNLVELR
jgi:flagellin FlaB